MLSAPSSSARPSSIESVLMKSPHSARLRRRAQRAANQVFLPIAIGQILASAETLSVRHEHDDDGLLRGVSAQRFEPGSRRRRLAEMLDHRLTPKALGAITLAASAALALGRGNRRAQIATSTVIAVANRLSEIRTPYGRDGADQMTSVVTQYRALSALVPDARRGDELFFRAVNLQTALSYFVSGAAKAFGSSWVQGDAISEIIQTEAYGSGPGAAFLRRHPRLTRFATVGTVLWELAFPLVYLVPQRHADHVLTAVKAFHIGVAAAMELPRFVWGFFGAHGAVSYVLHSRARASILEKTVLGVVAGLTIGSAVAAHHGRRTALLRRRGPKGTALLHSTGGDIEYALDLPPGYRPGDDRLLIVMECGLGQPLEAWDWLVHGLAEDYAVLRYHRPGYGRTTVPDSGTLAVEALLDVVGGAGEVVPVSHSIGSLAVASYATSPRVSARIRQAVLIDGTDPVVLEKDRSDRRSVGVFLQSQLHTLFASVTGVYQWTPSAIRRQSPYLPDVQFSLMHFVFAPRNIVAAVREYLRVDVSMATQGLKRIPRTLVVASSEYAVQEREFAESVGAEYELVEGSTHRTIIGDRQYASSTEALIRRFLDA